MGINEKTMKRRRAEIVAVVSAGLLAIGVGIFALFSEASPATLRAIFFNADGVSSARLKLTIANSERARAKGLMYVKPHEMGKEEGMLFVYPGEGRRTFWMRNTYTALDMIFLNRSLEVVGVLHDVPILNDEPRGVSRPSMYVVELHAGSARRFGIREGSQLRIDGKVPVAVD